jgi:transcriptional regulator with XRE-family HTH domain
MSAASFGQLLRDLRLRVGISQNALARRAGIDVAYINRLERVRQSHSGLPSRRVVLALAYAAEASRLDSERLLIAAGLCPDSLIQLGTWDSSLVDLLDVLADPHVSDDDRAELRELLRIVTKRWRSLRPPIP